MHKLPGSVWRLIVRSTMIIVAKFPNGKKVKWECVRPPMNPKKDKVRIYKAAALLFVSLPPDVDGSILRGIKGSNYEPSMKMYCVELRHLQSLIATLYRDSVVRNSYWPPAYDNPSLRVAADEITHLVVEAERARLGTTQENIPDFLEYNGTKPRAYQYEAARFMSIIGKAILALPLGSGKSITIITALKLLRSKVAPVFRGAVVFCPSALKELVWRREVCKFSDMKPVVIDGNKAERERQYAEPADIYILNPELLHRDLKQIRYIVERSSVVIVDEASILKNPESGTTKAIKKLTKNLAYTWLMTGTPLMNSVMELHTLVDIVDPNIFRSRMDFQRSYVPYVHGEWKFRGVVNTKNLIQKVAPVMFARTPSELRNELPESTALVEPVDLTEQQRALYDEIKNQADIALSMYNEAEPSDKFLIINNVLAAMTRMKQVCNGQLVDGANPKMERLIHMMNGELYADKVLVFSQYETTARSIVDALESEGVGCALLSGSVKSKDRSAAVDRYMNDADCRVFVMTTAGGMGLNLTKTTCVVYYDLLWNPQMMHQIAGRAIRIGNDAPHVRIISLVANNTIEETIAKRLKEKSATFNAVMHDESITPDNTEPNEIFHELLYMLKAHKSTNAKENKRKKL
jgi:SNF2 family DNA or RNA helicase